MEVSEVHQKYYEIFGPNVIDEVQKCSENKTRFVYYTKSETAIKIIENSELWFRNASVMNDASEISYGLFLISSAMSRGVGQKFREAVEDISPGAIERVLEIIGDWEEDWREETYIACISVHKDSEDKSGRLSMWRAYGDVALVVNNTPMMAMNDVSKVFSIPVSYQSLDGFEKYLDEIANLILINRKYLMGLGQDVLVKYIERFFFRIAISTKHPGFSEECEWRLYYRPTEGTGPAMVEKVEVIGGVPQVIYALPLISDAALGLHGADIPSLLNRIILGPMSNPYMAFRAFEKALSDKGVEEAAKKISASDIPLRPSDR